VAVGSGKGDGDIISNRSISSMNRTGDTSDSKSGTPCVAVAGGCVSSSSSGIEHTSITSKGVGGKSLEGLKTTGTNRVQRDLGEGNLSFETVTRVSDCSGNDVPHGNFVGHVIGSGRSRPVGKTSASCDQLHGSKMIITKNKVPTGLCDYNVVVKPVSNKIFRVSLQGALIGPIR
jgi:hypothetical protein